jgi:TM2 domain-containing membrane protein YozV
MKNKKSMFTAIFLSLFVTGLGHAYAGKPGKGLALFIITMALWSVMLGWIIDILAIFDVYTVTKEYNNNLLKGGKKK